MAIYSDFEKMHRNIDIQLWVDDKNRLWVMWTHSPYYEDSTEATIRTEFKGNYHAEFTGVEALICNNPDADKLIWEAPREICGGFIRSQPIIRQNGDYVFPAYDWINAENYVIRVSKDKGETFTDVIAAKKPQNNVYDETVVFEVQTRLYIVARTNLGFYLASYSDDDGKTWCEPYEFQKAPSTRLYIGRLSTGQLAYVRNVSDTERTGMKICISEDDGKTWGYELVLEIRENVSYPDLVEDENGTLYIVHDCERDNRYHLNRDTWQSSAAKEIMLSKINLRDIYNGTLGEDSYISRVISKAEINFVEK